MPLETVLIDGLPELSRKLDAVAWWQHLERIIPRALTPVLVEARARMPRGRTGKLLRGGLETRTERRQGGIQVAVGARVPYGHLVEAGHRLVARGGGRGFAPSRRRRAELRSALKARRARGAIGQVAGRPFLGPAYQARAAETVS
ncbi:MAG: HK97 gp10 family phage protein, partial [bacterium]